MALAQIFPSSAVVLKPFVVGRPACQALAMRITMAFRAVGSALKTEQQADVCAGPDSSGFCSLPTFVCVSSPSFVIFSNLRLTISQLTLYSITALIALLLIWFNIWTHADVIRVGNHPELVLSTIAASLGVFTSSLGWAGVLLNNRAFLAWYTFLLWITFAFLVAPGYITYKKHTFNLEGKINSQWSRDLGEDGRLRIQDQLDCCGYFNPFIEATVTQTCYARSILPGCKAPYLRFERTVLERWFTIVFAIVPLHIFIMVTALLCSNHVTYRFGKGMMPKAYRLSMNSMAVIMEQYAQYVLLFSLHFYSLNSLFL
jgi:hypothetical protein